MAAICLLANKRTKPKKATYEQKERKKSFYMTFNAIIYDE